MTEKMTSTLKDGTTVQDGTTFNDGKSINTDINQTPRSGFGLIIDPC